MSKRTAKLVFTAIFVSLLAGIPLVTASHGAPAEADKCLSGPKGAPPAGGHWYYRVDRATKRACWYVGDAKEKLAPAAPETSPPAAASVAPSNSARTQLSIANARAEFPAPAMRPEPETFAGQRAAPATIAGAINPENDRRANASDTGADRSVVAARWFEPTSMASSAPSQASADQSANQPQVASELAPPTAPFRLAAADASSVKPSGSVQQLLIVIVGALALAGLLASAIFRLSGARRTGRRATGLDGRVNWDLARTSRRTPPDETQGAASLRAVDVLPEAGFSRDPRAAEDPNERIAQMLTRLARSTAT